MKVAILCLCLVSPAYAGPIIAPIPTALSQEAAKCECRPIKGTVEGVWFRFWRGLDAGLQGWFGPREVR
jgi:hypothetical protein